MMRETRKAGCGEGPLIPVVPRTLGSASTVRARDVQAACRLSSDVAGQLGSVLEDQVVAHETSLSNLGHRLQRGPFHFVVSGPPSSTVAPLVRDPQHVYGHPNSSARKRGLHPPSDDGIRIADQSAKKTGWQQMRSSRSLRRAVSLGPGSEVVGNRCGERPFESEPVTVLRQLMVLKLRWHSPYSHYRQPLACFQGPTHRGALLTATQSSNFGTASFR